MDFEILNRTMVKEERFDFILKELTAKNTVTYEVLAQLLQVSEDTIRRDIDYLYRNGLLTKVRSGAMLRSKDPLSFQERLSISASEKDVIALKAQRFVHSGMTLFMDGGTTTCNVVRYFPADIQLRIITNNPELILIAKNFANIELILLGGTYHREMAITLGNDTYNEAQNYNADLYFMGSCAVNNEFGVSSVDKTDAEIKRAMQRSSKQTIVLADERKIGRSEPFRAVDIQLIDTLITNMQSDSPALDIFRNGDLQIV